MKYMHVVFVAFVLLLQHASTNHDKNSGYRHASIPVYGNSADGYYITISVGTPAQEVNVLIDTGSSNLAIAVSDTVNLSNVFHVNESKSFHKLNETIQVEYTEGSWAGFLGTDVVSFSDGLTTRGNLACIVSSRSIFVNNSQWQGILGLAFNSLSKPRSSFVTIFDKVRKMYNMDNKFSLELCGHQGKNGVLMFGDFLPNLYDEEIIYTPLRRDWYYEVMLIDISVGDSHWPYHCRELNDNKTIIDSGTSDLRLPIRVFSWFLETIYKHANIILPKDFLTNTKLICLQDPVSSVFPIVTLMLYREAESLSLNIAPELYLRQVSENATDSGTKCYKLAVSSTEKGTVIGAAILEGFYVVFDRQNKTVGFANSTCLSNGSLPSGWVTLQNSQHRDFNECVFMGEDEQRNSFLHVTAYVLVAVSVICFIPLLVMLLHWIWHHLMCFKPDSESNRLLDNYHSA